MTFKKISPPPENFLAMPLAKDRAVHRVLRKALAAKMPHEHGSRKSGNVVTVSREEISQTWGVGGNFVMLGRKCCVVRKLRVEEE